MIIYAYLNPGCDLRRKRRYVLVTKQEGTAVKVDDVGYSFLDEKKESGDMKVDFVWKHGTLYLSLSGLLLDAGGKWYEITIEDLQTIRILCSKPTKLLFELGGIAVILVGKNAETLIALRHMLAPFMDRKRKKKLDDRSDFIAEFLKLWGVGARDLKAIGCLCGTDLQNAKRVKQLAVKRGYIDERGEVSQMGECFIRLHSCGGEIP